MMSKSAKSRKGTDTLLVNALSGCGKPYTSLAPGDARAHLETRIMRIEGLLDTIS
jgi:hypothetical protein